MATSCRPNRVVIWRSCRTTCSYGRLRWARATGRMIRLPRRGSLPPGYVRAARRKWLQVHRHRDAYHQGARRGARENGIQPGLGQGTRTAGRVREGHAHELIRRHCRPPYSIPGDRNPGATRGVARRCARIEFTQSGREFAAGHGNEQRRNQMAGTATIAAAAPSAGTSAKALVPWATRPPTLLQPATQPVARPRTRIG